MSKKISFTNDNGERYPAWEQKKLGEVATIVMGQSPKGSYYSEDVSNTVLIQGNADLKNGRVVPRIYTSFVTKECLENDIIMSVRAPVGTVAKTDIVACIGRGVCAIRANEYIYQFLKYHESIDGWDKISQGSTFESVNSTDIKSLIVPLPSLPEQEKIAEFFSALDERIDLIDNKVKLLKERKKGYLQRVFSGELAFTDDNGERYPAWEQKKLGEVFDIKSSSDIDYTLFHKVQSEEYKYPVFGNAISQKGLLGYYKVATYITPAITVTGRGEVGVPFERRESFSAVGRLLVLTPKSKSTNNKFFAEQISLMNTFIESTGVPQLTAPSISIYTTRVPHFSEQKKIADFFSALDEEIELNENKLSLLKEQKKGYLQGTFG